MKHDWQTYETAVKGMLGAIAAVILATLFLGIR